MKRFFSLVLMIAVLATAFALLPAAQPTASADTWLQGRFAYLESVLPTGKYWNTVSGYYAVTLTGGAADYTTYVSSSPCPSNGSTDTCGAYRTNGGTGTPLSWQCFGFTDMLGYYLTGVRPWGNWERIGAYSQAQSYSTKEQIMNNLMPGDILCYHVQSTEGHKVMVTGVNGDTISIVEANYGGNCKINRRTISRSAYLNNTIYYCLKYPGGTHPADLGSVFWAYIRHQSKNVYLTNQKNNIGGEAFTGASTQVWRFNRQSNGAYSISSAYDNSCMDVLGVSLDDGANVYAYTGGYEGNANQEFYIYQMYDAYYLSPAHTNGTKMLDMNLTTCNLEMWAGGEDWAPQEFDIEIFKPTNIGEVFYAFIRNQSKGVYLTNQKNNIGGEAFTGDSTQVWRFNRQSNGAYSISSAYDNSCIDVLGVSLDDGANVYAYTGGYEGNANQEFYIYRMSDAYYLSPAHTDGTKMLDMNQTTYNLEMWGRGYDWAPQEFDIEIFKPTNIGDGFYAFIRNQSKDVYLTNQKNNIGGEAYTGNSTQVWKFNRQSNGAYAIISAYDNSCMDVLGVSLDDGANVYAYTGGFEGNANQEFYIYRMSDAYYLSPAHTDGTKMVDMNQTTYNLEMWGRGYDWAPQEFDIIETEYPLVTHVISVDLNESELEMEKGSTYALAATVAPNNATNKAVTWSSSDTNVATVDAQGVVTAVANGTATITVTTADGGKTATCAITVKTSVTGVTLSQTNATLEKGSTLTLTATVAPSDASNKAVTWSSSNTSVATVSSSGVITAVANGTATITVTTADGGKTATCAVTVKTSVTGVTLSQTSATIEKGSTLALTATVAPSDAGNKAVTWSSSNTSVATVSSTGVVTAKANGTATITVTTADGGKTATCAVTVNTSVTGVTLNYTNATLEKGSTLALTATVAPSDASNKAVTWSSSNTSVATVSSTGVVTAVANGTATITVTTADGGKTETCTLTVKPSVTGVTLNHISATVAKGSTLTLIPTITPSDTSNKAVTWASSDPEVATVSSSGVVTGQADGTATITVTTVEGGYTATCEITVNSPVTGITVSPTTKTLSLDETAQLTATIQPSDASNRQVSWSSSDPSVVSVSSRGVITGVDVGTATITVTTADGGYTATCTVTVAVRVTGVQVKPETKTLNVGEVYKLTATVQPSDATNKAVTWTSSPMGVVQIDAQGIVTAIRNGTTTITATTADGGYTDTCVVTVNTSVTGVTLDKSSASLKPGDTLALTATVAPSGASNKAVTWTSSNANVATVSSAGLVTAKAVGTARITVTTVDGGYTAICTVKVVPVLTLPSGLIEIGEEAFAGSAAAIVVIPQGCEEIGARAFADCADLTDIYIPASVLTISRTAFAGCPADLVIHGASGSVAQSFAKARGYAFAAE